jgi:squalene-hopene/tetraprenyl-beta-curcumene cyclase
MSVVGPALSVERLREAYAVARRALLEERVEAGHWVGELATSALSTATAVSALSLVLKSTRNGATGNSLNPDRIRALVADGVRWLTAHQNEDGGWGDTQASYSNISTTLLAIAALHLAGVADQHVELLRRAQKYVDAAGGWPALRKRYGRDKTFAVPILTNCALAGLVSWREVSALPFELACFPQSMYRMLRLPVVSYAIPALVAIGQAHYFHRTPLNPITRWLRGRLVAKSLNVLQRMQPASGGYLEAVPLTSFVVMSLAATERAEHAVTHDGVRFLMNSVRPDGSWPIDTNLATWNTTLSLNALAAGGSDIAEQECLGWLLGCQTKQIHPFTGAEPGGWGWTDLTGSVPDADDTPSALLALATWSRSRKCSGRDRRRIRDAASAGVRWLLKLQNSNGGWPTFCRGWGKLPFDRSGADLTAHTIRALHAWSDLVECGRATQRGLNYLARVQQRDGSWLPLWFGNQDHPREENPVYGTAKVLLAYRDLGLMASQPARRGREWLISAQNPDGGWGGGRSQDSNGGTTIISSVEETALAIEALLADQNPITATSSPASNPSKAPANGVNPNDENRPFEGMVFRDELVRGLNWLIAAVEGNRFRQPSPIGFYFAKLWYHEKLYPIIFTTSALGQAVHQWSASAEQSAVKSHLVSVAADGEVFPERTESKRQLAPSGKDDPIVPTLKQPCP